MEEHSAHYDVVLTDADNPVGFQVKRDLEAHGLSVYCYPKSARDGNHAFKAVQFAASCDAHLLIPVFYPEIFAGFKTLEPGRRAEDLGFEKRLAPLGPSQPAGWAPPSYIAEGGMVFQSQILQRGCASSENLEDSLHFESGKDLHNKNLQDGCVENGSFSGVAEVNIKDDTGKYHNVRIAVCDAGTLHVLDDKVSACKLADSLGIPQPRMYKGVEDVRKWPCVFKRSSGHGGDSVYFPKDSATLGHLLSTSKPGSYIIQEHMGLGGEVSVEAFRWGGQFYASAYRVLLPRAKGASVLRISVPAPKLVAYARRMLEAIDFNGVCGFDFIRGRFLEANPRFCGGLASTLASGLDLPWLLYTRATLTPLPPGATLTALSSVTVAKSATVKGGSALTVAQPATVTGGSALTVARGRGGVVTKSRAGAAAYAARRRARHEFTLRDWLLLHLLPVTSYDD